MKGLLQLLLAALFLISCQALPVIKSPASQAGSELFVCPAPFLKDKYRLVHAIEIHSAGTTRGGIIGVTVIDPVKRIVSCAIMTAEGMVLLEAEDNVSLKVIRALPPFDSAPFAENLIEDVKLIFFAPRGDVQKRGTLPDGSTVCRWREADGGWIDIASGASGGMEISKYTTRGSLKRRVRLHNTRENIYSSIELSATELFDYSLIMKLIEAAPAEGDLKMDDSEGPAQ
jgi:hypothetical protein